jgi:cell division protein FtsI (penicillin-binding protein 3)
MSWLSRNNTARRGDTTATGSSARRPRTPESRRRGDLLSTQISPWRSKLLLFVMFCAFGALAGRVFYLQGGGSTGFLQRKGEAITTRNVNEAPPRAAITDRNGVIFASSTETRWVWVKPESFHATDVQLAELAGLLGMGGDELRKRTSAVDRPFVSLARHLSGEAVAPIAALGLSGLHIDTEYDRQYPEGPVISSLIGFTDPSNQGIEGVERTFDSTLKGRPGVRHITLDRIGRTIEDNWVHAPAQGQDLHLSIDDRVQFIAHDAIRRAAEANAAKAAAAVVLDARTGELLALANWPDFDPSQRGQVDPALVRDRAVTDTFEPGSTLKPFSIATAIEKGVVKPDTMIDTAPGRWTVSGHAITDDHVHGMLTVEQILAKSSNVGTSKIALLTGLQPADLWGTLTAVGFGHNPQAELSGSVAGRLRSANTWHTIEHATISYGYGISVSLLQLAHAYLVFARQGDIVPVSIQRLDHGVPPTAQVFSPATVMKMRHMMEMATSPEGTAPAARISGYRVAGKTGTALKSINGSYAQKRYIASFVGFAPASDPRIVVAVMVDDPRGGHIYGGEVAAPVFGAIASGTLRTLQVPPDQEAPQLAQAAVSVRVQ